MIISIATLVGSAASTLTTICFIPQVIKIIQTKDTESISLLMYLVFTIGVALWFTYGVMLHSYPMIIGNIVTFLSSLVILAYKIKHLCITPKENPESSQ
jgi:MtN3 and saliva related transmembrane protein